jgi:hypothetical protein
MIPCASVAAEAVNNLFAEDKQTVSGQAQLKQPEA